MLFFEKDSEFPSQGILFLLAQATELPDILLEHSFPIGRKRAVQNLAPPAPLKPGENHMHTGNLAARPRSLGGAAGTGAKTCGLKHLPVAVAPRIRRRGRNKGMNEMLLLDSA